MPKKYNYIVNIIVEATCESPLRIGNRDNDTEDVLKDREGVPFIPGTSIAGVLREYVTSAYSNESLFGGQNRDGRLVVSDGIFCVYEKVLRSRIRIDKQTGTVDQGGKFDVAHIEKGGRFAFTLTWLGLKEELDEVEMLYDALANLNQGNLTFGSQRTNGFGRVSIEVKECRYDLTKEADRNQWLVGKDTLQVAQKITLDTGTKEKKVIFEVKGKVDNLLIKGEMKSLTDKSDFIENMRANNIPVIPASSIKGAIRERMLEIAQHLQLDVDEEIFGSESKVGTVFFHDVLLEDAQPMKFTRIHINKFTGGVVSGGLFTEETVASDVSFIIKAPQDDTTCKLLSFALRDMAVSFFTLGSGKAIGRGQVDVREIIIKTPDGKSANIKVNVEGVNKVITMQDADRIIANWMQ